jgi:TPP-dependent pyruvate/acetoin dehydrogenase alpha subunit
MLAGMAEVKLSTAARAFRAVHALVAGAFLLAIGYVWWCALTGQRDGWLRVAVASVGDGSRRCRSSTAGQLAPGAPRAA